ncbi:NlpC/P60 family protein [Salinimicrobium sp. GXAS 041]|uniref:C40 family peptidase n=1 Tax=Salinimicrobium sp. GXAS 041 TaxID=3400806 RepID=UPI003C752ECE
MQYGICNLSAVSLRLEPSERSEMTSQLLYGEHFKVLENRDKWSKIRVAHDLFEGWINNSQYLLISEENYSKFDAAEPVFSADLVELIFDEKQNLLPIPLGSVINFHSFLAHKYDGKKISGKTAKTKLLETAFLYLNTPFLWGGKSPFGIDASGLTQMVYRLSGYQISRNAAQQAQQGESLSFIEESEPGDLAFFDDKEGIINHVGLMMHNNYIIHAFGKVRVDRIDHSGIYNAELRRHTHKLRVIKKII